MFRDHFLSISNILFWWKLVLNGQKKNILPLKWAYVFICMNPKSKVLQMSTILNQCFCQHTAVLLLDRCDRADFTKSTKIWSTKKNGFNNHKPHSCMWVQNRHRVWVLRPKEKKFDLHIRLLPLSSEAHWLISLSKFTLPINLTPICSYDFKFWSTFDAFSSHISNSKFAHMTLIFCQLLSLMIVTLIHNIRNPFRVAPCLKQNQDVWGGEACAVWRFLRISISHHHHLQR